jgi:hypothetical protein
MVSDSIIAHGARAIRAAAAGRRPVVPDVDLDAAGRWRAAKFGISFSLLVAPTTTGSA